MVASNDQVTHLLHEAYTFIGVGVVANDIAEADDGVGVRMRIGQYSMQRFKIGMGDRK